MDYSIHLLDLGAPQTPFYWSATCTGADGDCELGDHGSNELPMISLKKHSKAWQLAHQVKSAMGMKPAMTMTMTKAATKDSNHLMA